MPIEVFSAAALTVHANVILGCVPSVPVSNPFSIAAISSGFLISSELCGPAQDEQLHLKPQTHMVLAWRAVLSRDKSSR